MVLQVSGPVILLGLLLPLVQGQPAPSNLPQELLPPALRGLDLNRLSSGSYSMLQAAIAARSARAGANRAAVFPGAADAVKPATLDPKIGRNLSLGDDPPALPPDRRGQAEPHVIRSYTQPGLLLATFQEGRFTDGGAVDCGYAFSHDAGQTWTRALIPHLTTTVDDGVYERASDPVAAVDLQGNLYLNTLGIVGPAPNFITSVLLTKSTDGGRTFGPPLVVHSGGTPTLYSDKNWLAINTFPGTATANRIVATFTYYITTNRSGFLTSYYPIVSTYSDDGGEHWSPLRVISPDYCQGSQPFFLPDGSLAVVYWNFLGPTGDQIELVISEDGGATFGAPRLVTRVTTYADPVARAWGFLPSAVTDRETGTIYLTYQAKEPEGVPQALFTKSVDKGGTWTTPRAVNDTPLGRSVFNPAVAASPDGQHVTIVFYDKRHDTDDTGQWVDFYLAESFDGGDTWNPNLRLSEVSTDLSLAPLTSGGRMIGDYHGVVPALDLDTPGVAIWVDTRTGSPDPFVVSIRRTQGTTFAAWRRLRFSPAELANAQVSAEAADPDADGLPNLLEYALGLNPRGPQAPWWALSRPSGPGEPLVLEFEASAVLSDIRFTWRGTSDLVHSSESTPLFEEVLPASNPSLRRHRVGFPTHADPRQFYRLGATRLGP